MIQLNSSALTTIQAVPKSYVATTLNIYSGVIPDVNSSFVFNKANYQSQLLATLVMPYLNNSSQPTKLSNNGTPSFDGLAEGTATWFCLTNAAGAGYLLGTLSSDPATKAPLLIDNVNITQTTGKPFSLVSFAINLS